MKINIQTIHFKFRQQLNEVLQKKLKKFNRLCEDIISIDVKLTLQTQGKRLNKLCGIRLVIRGNDMLCNTKGESFEEAIARAVEALERQIEKRKTKIKRQLTASPQLQLIPVRS